MFAKTAWGLGRDWYVEPVGIVFNTSFRYTGSWYTLWLVNFDSLLQHLRQSLYFARARETLLHSAPGSPAFFARPSGLEESLKQANFAFNDQNTMHAR